MSKRNTIAALERLWFDNDGANNVLDVVEVQGHITLENIDNRWKITIAKVAEGNFELKLS